MKMMTPDFLLPDIWKYVIYPKLEIYELNCLRSTSKNFWNCNGIKALLRKKIIECMNGYKNLHKFLDLKNIETFSEKVLFYEYWATRRINITLQNDPDCKLWRMYKEIGKLEKMKIIKNIKFAIGISSFYLDLRPPKNSPYKNIKYYVEFPKKFPFEKPEITCLTKLFHPNYDFIDVQKNRLPIFCGYVT
jgi:hypothetical protein